MHILADTLRFFLFHAVEQVLKHFRDRFITEVEAGAIIMELLDKDIIPDGVQEKIAKTDSPKQQNEILHARLMKTCTIDALRTVCEIIMKVRGNPKMKALGEAMTKSLETGKCCAFVFVCVFVCVFACVLLLMIISYTL